MFFVLYVRIIVWRQSSGQVHPMSRTGSSSPPTSSAAHRGSPRLWRKYCAEARWHQDGCAEHGEHVLDAEGYQQVKGYLVLYLNDALIFHCFPPLLSTCFILCFLPRASALSGYVPGLSYPSQNTVRRWRTDNPMTAPSRRLNIYGCSWHILSLKYG